MATNKGSNGWKRLYNIGDTGGTFAIGGQNGRALLCFPGNTCDLIKNNSWPLFIYLMTEVYDGRITRWDGAADDFEGIHSIDWAINQYHGDGFQTKGNKPKSTIYDHLEEDNTDGRTLYVGCRKNAKFVRIYEKGKQLGNPNSLWVRWELELKRKGIDVPWDVLLKPGQYVAGAHKCMGWIQNETSRIATRAEKLSISEEALVRSCRNSYGTLAYFLKEKYGYKRAIQLLMRPGMPARLQIPSPLD